MSGRPTNLKEVAAQSASLAEFGLNLRDWLHELRRASFRGTWRDVPQAVRPVASTGSVPAFVDAPRRQAIKTG